MWFLGVKNAFCAANTPRLNTSALEAWRVEPHLGWGAISKAEHNLEGFQNQMFVSSP